MQGYRDLESRHLWIQLLQQDAGAAEASYSASSSASDEDSHDLGLQKANHTIFAFRGGALSSSPSEEEEELPPFLSMPSSCSLRQRRNEEHQESAHDVTSAGDEEQEQLESSCLYILDSIPRDEEGRLTSLGSVHHASGTCRPCVYWAQGNCMRSVSCYSCHFSHPAAQERKFKQAWKRAAQKLDDPIAHHAAMQRMDQDHKTMLSLPCVPGQVNKDQVKVTVSALQAAVVAHGYQVAQASSSSA
eukprot:TRINITY_DN70659_c0_g1_i1.p1 TRINITY_DN70659_c0_g1~~TRINITY_DN70659_c0_g1_i1.p1  ORF type:complete len:245 (-),score=45.00 TRINITY_DN70659_c0_g1_i1:35-769(-)